MGVDIIYMREVRLKAAHMSVEMQREVHMQDALLFFT
jgi:hypothetical protein